MDYEADERLLRDYVTADPPLHIRRTLDQYCFVNLDDTSKRDKDQVVYRGTLDKRDSRTQSRVIMVDQLWLWILDNSKRPDDPLVEGMLTWNRYGHHFIPQALGQEQARPFGGPQEPTGALRGSTRGHQVSRAFRYATQRMETLIRLCTDFPSVNNH